MWEGVLGEEVDHGVGRVELSDVRVVGVDVRSEGCGAVRGFHVSTVRPSIFLSTLREKKMN